MALVEQRPELLMSASMAEAEGLASVRQYEEEAAGMLSPAP